MGAQYCGCSLCVSEDNEGCWGMGNMHEPRLAICDNAAGSAGTCGAGKTVWDANICTRSPAACGHLPTYRAEQNRNK